MTSFALLPLLGAGCPPNQSGTRYFLVAEREPAQGDSYILPLTDPAAIAHALALINHPDSTDAPLVVAKISPGGSDGEYVNRDLAGSGEAWSWRVSAFEGFADFTIEVQDGWPGYVEDNYDDYTASSGGYIGFWNYTVVREVQVSEMAYDDFAPADFPPNSPLANLP
nr:hypothetical protein [uncultured bacterium]